MGRVEQDHVLHVLVDVPWVRLDEVKKVVGDDPTDPVVLGCCPCIDISWMFSRDIFVLTFAIHDILLRSCYL